MCAHKKKEEHLYAKMTVLHSNNAQEATSQCPHTDLILLKLQTTHKRLSRPALWCQSLIKFLKKNKLIRGSISDGAPSSVNISRRGHHDPFLEEMYEYMTFCEYLAISFSLHFHMHSTLSDHHDKVGPYTPIH
jgi:hypothetical protein